MNRTKNHKTPSHHDADQLMEELLSAWDSSNSQLDTLLAMYPPVVNFARIEAQRRKNNALSITMASAFAVLAVATAIVFHPLSTDRGLRLIGIVLVAVSVILAFYCLWHRTAKAKAAVTMPQFSALQVSTIGLVSLLLLVVIPTLPVGDGYYIAQTSSLISRAHIVGNINQLFCTL